MENSERIVYGVENTDAGNSSAVTVDWSANEFIAPLTEDITRSHIYAIESFKSSSEIPLTSTLTPTVGGGYTALSDQQRTGLNQAYSPLSDGSYDPVTFSAINLDIPSQLSSTRKNRTVIPITPVVTYPPVIPTPSETFSIIENYPAASILGPESAVESHPQHFDLSSTGYHTDTSFLPSDDAQKYSIYHPIRYVTQMISTTVPGLDDGSPNIAVISPPTYVGVNGSENLFQGHLSQIPLPNGHIYGHVDEQTPAQNLIASDALYNISHSTRARLLNPLDNNPLWSHFQPSAHPNFPCNSGPIGQQVLPVAHRGFYQQLDNVLPERDGPPSVSTIAQVDSGANHMLSHHVPNTSRKQSDLSSTRSKATSHHPYLGARSYPPLVVRRRPKKTEESLVDVIHHTTASLDQQSVDAANSAEAASTCIYRQALNAKQPRGGQRGKFDPKMLKAAFLNQPGLKKLLEAILSTSWYRKEELEPRINSPCGVELLTSVCHAALDDGFTAKLSNIMLSPDDPKRDLSIYLLFKETNSDKCLFCNTHMGRQESFLSHVRSHLDHRPYECEIGTRCGVCDKDGIRRRFYSQRLLREHQAKPSKKVMCSLCRTSVQTAGAARHLKTVHKITPDNWAPYFPFSAPSTPASEAT